MSRYDEYLICKVRGHDSSGSFVANAIYGALAWYTCKYCGTDFATQTTTKLLERNEPQMPVVVEAAPKEPK